MKLEDAKEGVKVEFEGKTRVVVIDKKTERPKIRNGKYGKKVKKQRWSWEYQKWELKRGKIKTTNSSNPTLHMIWMKHLNWESFDSYFAGLEKSSNQNEKLMSSQGWYCLGSKNHIGYIGLVGKVYKPTKGNRRQGLKTFRGRWNHEHDKEKIADAKFPNGYFRGDKIKIKSQPARLYTASIVAARRDSTNFWQDTLLKRNIAQGNFIEEIEGCIIRIAALKHKDLVRPLKETKKFYKKLGRGWQGGASQPVAFSFPSNKTMVNFQNAKGFPNSVRLNGKFNIKFSGVMPENLEKIFSDGIYIAQYLQT